MHDALAALYRDVSGMELPASDDLPVFLPKFTRDHLARLFAQLNYQTVAEIGVAEGRYSAIICRENPSVHLLCVDPWAPYQSNGRGRAIAEQQKHFEMAQAALAGFNVQFCRAMSAEAAQTVPLASLDAVYIDGNHKIDYVREDLALWNARVRTGGIIAGHDYYQFRNAGVVEAVKEFTAAHRISPWYLTDARQLRPAAGGDYYKEQSFFWAKP